MNLLAEWDRLAEGQELDFVVDGAETAVRAHDRYRVVEVMRSTWGGGVFDCNRGQKPEEDRSRDRATDDLALSPWHRAGVVPHRIRVRGLRPDRQVDACRFGDRRLASKFREQSRPVHGFPSQGRVHAGCDERNASRFLSACRPSRDADDAMDDDERDADGDGCEGLPCNTSSGGITSDGGIEPA